jgi:hypothetical protein
MADWDWRRMNSEGRGCRNKNEGEAKDTLVYDRIFKTEVYACHAVSRLGIFENNEYPCGQ